ncbi:MAG: L-threonylcarbamoyladenylate synthase [Acutalibacteraceae bacterium]|nr:L-threonylcarbamoyladenylate synthase [Acutalibacteraceae bacterium]
METQILSKSEKDIAAAAEIIKNGGLVCIPTETVYGLGANAFDKKAVLNVFKAKGRAADNPLIVHITEFCEIYPLVKEVPEKARILAEKFWPGPLTMIFKKSDKIPSEVTCGMDTVAIRMPSHPVARAIIKAAGVPVAAPSANRSGGVSPVTAEHCICDLSGRVDAIVDGGTSEVGLESTVILMVGETPRLLRPGFVTPEQIEKEIGEIIIDKAILNPLEKGAKVLSPGMKYKHYSPSAKVIIIDADDEAYYSYVNQFDGEKVFALCYDEDTEHLDKPYLTFGAHNDEKSAAKMLFYNLHQFDLKGAKTVIARLPKTDGVGLAVVNRLLRAAGFEVVKL